MAAVLLVEDVPAVRTTLVKFLERGGHRVTVGTGGHEASKLMRSQHFDAVVTDLWMKDGDGVEFIQDVRASGDATPIIAITGGDPRSPQATSIDMALEVGADCALLKPVTKTALLATLDTCLAAKSP